MPARIGADDIHLFESPQPSLLRDATGIEPEPSGLHVLIDRHLGVRSAQRLALSAVGDGILVALWPAELKPQAKYLYSHGRGEAMVRTATQLGWDVWAVPQIGFFTSPAERRLYMKPDVDPAEYARRWQGADGRRIGQYSAEEVHRELWPWLKARGYAADDDDAVLNEFLSILGRRPAHLRPALRFHRCWRKGEGNPADRGSFAAAIRDDVNELLRAAEEPTLRGR